MLLYQRFLVLFFFLLTFPTLKNCVHMPQMIEHLMDGSKDVSDIFHEISCFKPTRFGEIFWERLFQRNKHP